LGAMGGSVGCTCVVWLDARVEAVACVGSKGESEGCTWDGRCAAVPRVDLNITGGIFVVIVGIGVSEGPASVSRSSEGMSCSWKEFDQHTTCLTNRTAERWAISLACLQRSATDCSDGRLPAFSSALTFLVLLATAVVFVFACGSAVPRGRFAYCIGRLIPSTTNYTDRICQVFTSYRGLAVPKDRACHLIRDGDRNCAKCSPPTHLDAK
jgi:hypothetical protein